MIGLCNSKYSVQARAERIAFKYLCLGVNFGFDKNIVKKRIRTPCLLQSSSDTFVLVKPTGIEPVSENLLI